MVFKYNKAHIAPSQCEGCESDLYYHFADVSKMIVV